MWQYYIVITYAQRISFYLQENINFLVTFYYLQRKGISMLSNVIHYFYPKLNREEIKKFSLLSFIFVLIIGTYWLLRLFKETLFLTIAFPESLGWLPQQGILFQPLAKSLSPFIVLAIVLIYSKLIDLFKKHQLFYIICSFYALIFAFITGVLFVNDLYGAEIIGRNLLASTGWFSYFAIESFGSLLPALFWSFVNSITTTESAKSGFPFVFASAQLGAIFGSGLLFFSDRIGSLWPIVALSAIFVISVVPLVKYFMSTTPAEQLVGNKTAAETEKVKEGFIQGLVSGFTLLITRPYLIGVLIVSTFYEAIAQVIEYQMKRQACLASEFCTPIAFAKFYSIYGVAINTLSFLIALLGTQKIIQKFGTRITLLIYPIAVFIFLIVLFGYFMLGAPSPKFLLWTIFGIMVAIKGLAYAINNPVKEIMYIPTSKDAKFKSKGWIDTFGSRFAKAGGAQITNAFKHNLTDLMIYGTMFGFGLNAIWFVAALYVGYKNSKLLKEGKIIE